MTNLSYVCGVGGEPLLYKTVGAVLEEAAARWGEREALIVRHQNIRWTYRELDEAADRLAAGSAFTSGSCPATGSASGRRTATNGSSRSSPPRRPGLILVTINPAYRTSELEYALNKVGCKALVLAPSFKTSDYAAMLEQIRPEGADAARGDSDRRRAARGLSPLCRRGVVRDRRGSRARAPAARRSCSRKMRSTSSSPAARRACRRARRCLITTSSTTATSSRSA